MKSCCLHSSRSNFPCLLLLYSLWPICMPWQMPQPFFSTFSCINSQCVNVPMLACLLNDNAVLPGERSAITALEEWLFPLTVCRKSIDCCQSSFTMKVHSVCFLKISGDSGAQTHLCWKVYIKRREDIMKCAEETLKITSYVLSKLYFCLEKELIKSSLLCVKKLFPLTEQVLALLKLSVWRCTVLQIKSWRFDFFLQVEMLNCEW